MCQLRLVKCWESGIQCESIIFLFFILSIKVFVLCSNSGATNYFLDKYLSIAYSVLLANYNK